ncbi:hypothetical protein [Streptomyces hygroscopicus]|uniref:hypothetical protein n=1 Tax=Streptomyces hygroscopicus TaxID=1912 RepID=UPI001FCBDF2C|nr:hypothetical protein [Streptomyces hygroscopicus]BDH16226.1 hypothetical protein HOK021_74050 [Streptomyces hygroscopicus]
MNTYRYRCDRCGISWPHRETLADADHDRVEHRAYHEPVSFRPALRMAAGIGIVGTAMAIWNWIHGR